jgi:type II secretion system protein C
LILLLGVAALAKAGTVHAEPPSPPKSAHRGIPSKGVPQAGQDIGLLLVGTVVADDPEENAAVIHDEATGTQGIYSRGDRVGEKAVVRDVLWDRVILETDTGEKIHIMLTGATGGSGSVSTARHQQQRGVRKPAPVKNPTVRLSRKEASQGDTDRVTEQVDVTPVTVYDRSVGIRVTNIAPGSILAKMGLENGTVIMSVNEEAITGPEKMKDFLEALKHGGEFTIKVRSRGVRRRSRIIHIQIE